MVPKGTRASDGSRVAENFNGRPKTVRRGETEAMRLTVMVPAEILVDEEVGKVIAEAENGCFCLLPRHVDFVAALVPGILTYESTAGKEVMLAVDAGVLVKCGKEVKVSTRRGVIGPDLGNLRRTVEENFKILDDKERTARVAAAKIEAGFVRRFLELQKHG